MTIQNIKINHVTLWCLIRADKDLKAAET